MATAQFKARVKDHRTLELPEEARILGLEVGDEVTVSVGFNGSKRHGIVTPAEQGLLIMREIAERHKTRRVTENGTTQRLIEEARSGAAYGNDPAE